MVIFIIIRNFVSYFMIP